MEQVLQADLPLEYADVHVAVALGLEGLHQQLDGLDEAGLVQYVEPVLLPNEVAILLAQLALHEAIMVLAYGHGHYLRDVLALQLVLKVAGQMAQGHVAVDDVAEAVPFCGDHDRGLVLLDVLVQVVEVAHDGLRLVLIIDELLHFVALLVVVQDLREELLLQLDFEHVDPRAVLLLRLDFLQGQQRVEDLLRYFMEVGDVDIELAEDPPEIDDVGRAFVDLDLELLVVVLKEDAVVSLFPLALVVLAIVLLQLLL